MSELKLIIEPDADEPGAAEVTVDGTIDGRAYRFLLDTGAAKSGVTLDDYTARFSSSGENHSSGVFASSSDDLITVPRLEVGPLRWQNVTLTRAAAGPGVRNLIGMDLLNDFRCHFLFDSGRVVLDGDIPVDERALIPLLMDQRAHPYVAVTFEDTSAHAVWDTGASLTVVDSNFIDAHPALFAEAGRSTGTDATGTAVETPMFTLSSAAIGGYAFPPLRVAAVDLGPVNASIEIPMDMILGYNVLSRANWLFDFPARTWAITRWLGR